MIHYHLRSKVALDLVDRVVDPGDVWRLSFSWPGGTAARDHLQ
jgi:hypothetical protein